MTKNNGITIVTLVITITVILILTSIFIATGLGALEEAENTKIENEMNQLRQAISARYTSYMKNDGNISLIGRMPNSKWSDANECINEIISTLDFSNASTEEKNEEESKITKNIIRDYETYIRIINSGDMRVLGLESFSDDNQYVVDYYTGHVYGPLNN